MNLAEYKSKMFDIANSHPKKARGAKYIRQWDIHYPEKNTWLKKQKSLVC